jgi:hypothetical protein
MSTRSVQAQTSIASTLYRDQIDAGAPRGAHLLARDLAESIQA